MQCGAGWRAGPELATGPLDPVSTVQHCPTPAWDCLASTLHTSGPVSPNHHHLPLTIDTYHLHHSHEEHHTLLLTWNKKKFKHFKFILKYIHLCILSCGAQFNAKKVFYDSTHSACFISFDDFRCLTQSLNIWQLLLMQTDHDTDTGLFRQLICVNLLHKVWRI